MSSQMGQAQRRDGLFSFSLQVQSSEPEPEALGRVIGCSNGHAEYCRNCELRTDRKECSEVRQAIGAKLMYEGRRRP